MPVGRPAKTLLCGDWLNNDILGKGLESLSVCLHDCNGYMASLPGLDISYGARLARVCTANDRALSAVSQCRRV
jgi:hypothetical protein